MHKRAIAEKVEPLLSLVGLSDKVHQYPACLSGGQKQRVAIARSLVHRPEVLLCDEATSSLDPNTTASILSLLQSIHKQFDITVVLITHEMDVARSICHNIAVMAEGRIVENNTTEQIFFSPYAPLTKQFVRHFFA